MRDGVVGIAVIGFLCLFLMIGPQHHSGIEKITREDGMVIEQCKDAQGQFHGHFRRWHPDGTLAMEVFYDHGTQLSVKTYAENGQKTFECWEENYELKCDSFTPEGVLLSSAK